jgi:hypothetical protein
MGAFWRGLGQRAFLIPFIAGASIYVFRGCLAVAHRRHPRPGITSALYRSWQAMRSG